MSISQSWEEPDTFYAANGQQVLKTADGGETWRPTGEELPEVSAVAVAPNDQRIVYAGVLEGTRRPCTAATTGASVGRPGT